MSKDERIEEKGSTSGTKEEPTESSVEEETNLGDPGAERPSETVIAAIVRRQNGQVEYRIAPNQSMEDMVAHVTILRERVVLAAMSKAFMSMMQMAAAEARVGMEMGQKLGSFRRGRR